MNLKEAGIKSGKYAINLGEKIIGVEAFRNTPADKSVIDALAGGVIQLLLPATSQKVKLVSGDKMMMEQIADANASLQFASEMALNLGLGFFAGAGLGWRAALIKLGYNVVVQVAPDVARLIRNRSSS